MNTLSTLFPKARAEIIRLLFPDPSRELHLRELTRLSGLAVGTLQSEVQKLEAEELLSTRRDGNRLYFKANTEHPIYPELNSIALKTTGLKERIQEALSGLKGIELAFLFGSMAKGEASAGSDVDLFIVGTVGLRTLSPKLRLLSNELGREINPYTISPKALAEKSRNEDAFILNVKNAQKLWIQGSDDEFAAVV